MAKVYGLKQCYVPVRETYSQTIISYSMTPEPDGVHATWYEVYFNKKEIQKPSLAQIKEAVIADINRRTDEKIVSGMVWTPQSGGYPIHVWLSQENQFNFKSAYDLAVQKQGATLPVTFKMGEKEDGTPIYHTFETMEDADDFYLHAVAHINTCLSAGWAEKDGIDWAPYEDYFKTEA